MTSRNDTFFIACRMTLFSDSMAIVVSGLFSDGSLNEGLQFVNANRVYRIMSENNLLFIT